MLSFPRKCAQEASVEGLGSGDEGRGRVGGGAHDEDGVGAEVGLGDLVECGRGVIGESRNVPLG